VLRCSPGYQGFQFLGTAGLEPATSHEDFGVVNEPVDHGIGACCHGRIASAGRPARDRPDLGDVLRGSDAVDQTALDQTRHPVDPRRIFAATDRRLSSTSPAEPRSLHVRHAVGRIEHDLRALHVVMRERQLLRPPLKPRSLLMSTPGWQRIGEKDGDPAARRARLCAHAGLAGPASRLLNSA
jgi:hypothetical protein